MLGQRLAGSLGWDRRAKAHCWGGMTWCTFGHTRYGHVLPPCPQWFLGFAVFLLPWASLRLRSLLKPIHVFFGASILSLAIASVISGINEKLFFSL